MAAKKKKTAKRRAKPKAKKKMMKAMKTKCDKKWLCKWLREGAPPSPSNPNGFLPFAEDLGYNYNNPPAPGDAWLAHANWFFKDLVNAVANLEAQVVYVPTPGHPVPPAQPPIFYVPGGGGTPPPPPPTYPPN